jgi:hypothetical protein
MANEPPKKISPKKGARRLQPKAPMGAAPADNYRAFTPDVLESTIITLPLLDLLMDRGASFVYDIIIDVNRDYPGGRDKAQQRIKDLIAALVRTHGVDPREQGVHVRKTDMTRQYVFGRLRGDLIQELSRRIASKPSAPATRSRPSQRSTGSGRISRSRL